MKLKTLGVTLALVFAFAFGFSASFMVTISEAAECPCTYWCVCNQAFAPGQWLTPSACGWDGITPTACKCVCF